MQTADGKCRVGIRVARPQMVARKPSFSSVAVLRMSSTILMPKAASTHHQNSLRDARP